LEIECDEQKNELSIIKTKTMKKMQGYFGLALAMAMMPETNFRIENEPKLFEPPKPPKKVIPKGCKEYWFFKSGEFSNQKPNASYEIVFECIASSDKKAVEKHKKFISNLHPKQ